MFPFYMILAELRENPKVVSSDFSMIKSIAALSALCLPIKLTCYFKLGLSNLICLLKSIVINW